jgi:monofunctional glycosyltransferase
VLYEVMRDELGSQMNVDLNKIPVQLRQAAIDTEDNRFYSNPGIDLVGLGRAFWINLMGGETISGGSTITQQVARNLLLSPSRSPVRKFKEMLIGRYLERTLDKDRILEIYLNIVEWGQGVFGAEAASLAYFGKHASDLSVEEAVDLAIALPSPYERRPDKPATDQVLRLRERLLERMRKAGYSPEGDEETDGE